MSDDDLEIFVTAQNPVLARVEAELAEGRKRSHWMWFVFPQVIGLGRSVMSLRYAIRDLDHARRYLAHPVLSERLRRQVRLVSRHGDRTAHEIFSSPDDLKFRACLTLFRAAATKPEDAALFDGALQQFYAGRPDPLTLEILSRHD